MAPFHPISSPPRPHQSPSQQLSTYTQYQSLLDPSNAIASGSGTGRDKEKERDFMGMDPPDRLKRIRRLVLTEGIPEIVCLLSYAFLSFAAVFRSDLFSSPCLFSLAHLCSLLAESTFPSSDHMETPSPNRYPSRDRRLSEISGNGSEFVESEE